MEAEPDSCGVKRGEKVNFAAITSVNYRGITTSLSVVSLEG